MDYSLIQSVWTIVVLVLFVGIVLWAYSGKRRQHFEEASRIPFTEDTPAPTEKISKENPNG
ncbi:MAG: cbb3-type cytochrome c oxidase subunit 3 [Gammaproteobacteria bacterium]|nr:cbb3-type cytochrome c oxidase subunit 3 [Gammaproteobacteria bacterium]